MARMTRAERKAFRQEQREKRQAEREERRKQRDEDNNSENDNLGYLTGKQGEADVFTFSSLSDFGVQADKPDYSFHKLSDSHMFSFEDGLDKIDLSSFDANANQDGTQVFTFIGESSFSGTAGELRVIDQSAITGDLDGDGFGDFYFQFRDGFYTNSVELTQDDFILGSSAGVPTPEEPSQDPVNGWAPGSQVDPEPIPATAAEDLEDAASPSAPDGTVVHKSFGVYMSGTKGEADLFTFDELIDFGVRGDAPTGRESLANFAMFAFEDGLDFVDLSGLDADVNTAADDAFVFIADAAFSGQAGELQVTDNSVVRGDVDGDGTADFYFAFRDGFYTNNVMLTEADFLL